MIDPKPKMCAACGGRFTHAGFGKYHDFCSRACRKIGRAFCKACDKPLSQEGIAKRDFCDTLCQQRYNRKGGPISSSYLQDISNLPSRCKGCGKPIAQPKLGLRLFCSSLCGNRYRRRVKHGQNTAEEWGGFLPETRKALRNVEAMLSLQAARQVAIAIDREYMPRLPDPQNIHGEFITYRCKTCNKEFRRRPWGQDSTDYCSARCRPSTQTVGDNHHSAKLTQEKADEIRVLWKTGQYRLTALAERYNVSFQTISDVVNNKRWNWSEDDLQRSWRRRLTLEKAEEIRHLWATEHPTFETLAEVYGVSETAIRKIISNETWKPGSSYIGGIKGRFTQEQAEEIRHLHTTGHLLQREIAEKYGVSESTINDIIHYRTYKPETDLHRKGQFT